MSVDSFVFLECPPAGGNKAAKSFEKIVGAQKIPTRLLSRFEWVRWSANEVCEGGESTSGFHAVMSGQDRSVREPDAGSRIVVNTGRTAQAIIAAQQRRDCEVKRTRPEGEVVTTEDVHE